MNDSCQQSEQLPIPQKWKCAGCGEINTGEICICGISKAESALQYQKQAAKTSKKEKRKNLIMSLTGIFLILVALGALGYFVAWPYLVVPNLETSELNTPEIVRAYYGKDDTQGQIVFTVTSCTPEGKVYGQYEYFKDALYGRIRLEGQITQKKNRGDLTIAWTSETVDIETPGISWASVTETTITKKWETAQFGDITLSSVSDYTILKTVDDLKKLNGSGGNYILSEDMDLEGIPFTPIRDFSGTLLGNGHMIKNLQIEGEGSQIGFFANLTGTVINLEFQDAAITVTGESENIGILCGSLTGLAANISVSGEVTAESGKNVGGVIGAISVAGDGYSMVPKLYSQANVTGEENVGGIIGSLQNTSQGITLLDHCKNTGNVTGEERVGGICGYAGEKDSGLHMMVLSNTGRVDGETLVGGLCGEVTCNGQRSKEIDCSTKKGNKYGNEETS